MVDEKALEAGQIAARDSNGCGCAWGRDNVFCDDPRLPEPDSECICKRDFEAGLRAYLAAAPTPPAGSLAEATQEPVQAPVAMPGVEEIVARIICRRVHLALHSDPSVWRPGELDAKVDGYWHHYTDDAAAILALPAFTALAEENERLKAQCAQRISDASESSRAKIEAIIRAEVAEAALASAQQEESPPEVRVEYDDIILPSGRRFYAHGAIVGLREGGEFYGGYDQSFGPGIDDDPLSNEDRVALCRWMAERWLAAIHAQGE